MAVAQIETRERTGKSGKTYAQYFNSDGKLVGCGCAEAKAVSIEKYNFKPCSHMRTPVVVQRVALSCALCASWTYKADGVCGACYGY